MELMFNIQNSDDEAFTTSKKDVLKYLKIIGVDTRFISYTPNKIYINNLRFSKFSRKRQEIFEKQFGEIEVVRNKLFQKICSKSSKTLSSQLKPKTTILFKDDNYLIDLLLEPYTRKYGVEIVKNGEYDVRVNTTTLDDEVNNIFESIFKGEGIKFRNCENEIYPLINVSLDWINSFLEMDGQKTIEKQNTNEIANRFSEFLDDVTAQYKENVLKATEYVKMQNEPPSQLD